MAKEIRADPTELTKLAGETLEASKRLSDGFRTGYADMALPQAAFGNTAAGPQVYMAHETTLGEAEPAVGRLVTVQEGDVDKLYRVAFAYLKADHDAAAKVARSHRARGPDI